MKKITAQAPESRSADLTAENLGRLKALFPEAFTEGKVDFAILKQLLGEAVEENEEKYGLNWHGKRKARQLALTPSTGTLRPSPEDSVDWDTTRNLMIEGDNLEVLKLLQKSYAGRIKLIYIDPPYNTGNDFVYPDDFQDGIKNYQQRMGWLDLSGEKISSLAQNTRANGRFHTTWLNLMYPRLKLAKSLLHQDGVIFISIDDNEAANLKSISDEIFGEENFVAQLVWNQGRKSMASQVAINHEYCLIYCADRTRAIFEAKQKENYWQEKKSGLEPVYAAYEKSLKIHGKSYSLIEKDMRFFFRSLLDESPSKSHAHYNKVDERGLYFAGDISQGTGTGGRFEIAHPDTGMPCQVPAGGWRFGEDKLAGLLKENRIHFGKDHTTIPCLKRYLRETEYEVPASVFYRDGRGASKRLTTLMGADVFDYPKDEEILGRFIRYVTTEDDSAPICLDFFAGSGTLAHAVMAQNATDGGDRRHILVQLPESLDPSKSSQTNAADFCDSLGKPRNIAELTRERLRRAGTQLRDHNPMFAGDFGFRVFKLDSSNIRAWDPNPEDLEQTLLDAVETLRPDRDDTAILYEILLLLGEDLSTRLETKRIADKLVYASMRGKLFACLDRHIARDDVGALAGGIVTWYRDLGSNPEGTVIFLDSAFADDTAKANLDALLQQGGFEERLIRTL